MGLSVSSKITTMPTASARDARCEKAIACKHIAIARGLVSIQQFLSSQKCVPIFTDVGPKMHSSLSPICKMGIASRETNGEKSLPVDLQVDARASETKFLASREMTTVRHNTHLRANSVPLDLPATARQTSAKTKALADALIRRRAIHSVHRASFENDAPDALRKRIKLGCSSKKKCAGVLSQRRKARAAARIRNQGARIGREKQKRKKYCLIRTFLFKKSFV